MGFAARAGSNPVSDTKGPSIRTCGTRSQTTHLGPPAAVLAQYGQELNSSEALDDPSAADRVVRRVIADIVDRQVGDELRWAFDAVQRHPALMHSCEAASAELARERVRAALETLVMEPSRPTSPRLPVLWGRDARRLPRRTGGLTPPPTGAEPGRVRPRLQPARKPGGQRLAPNVVVDPGSGTRHGFRCFPLVASPLGSQDQVRHRTVVRDWL